MGNKMAIKITHYNQFKGEGFCKGSFGIHIEEWDLNLRDIREMQKHDGSRWFAYPSKEYVDKKGEKKYSQYFYFGKETNERFQAKLRLALTEYKASKGIQDGEQGQNTQSSDVPF